MDKVYFLCNGQNPKCKDRCELLTPNPMCIHTSDPRYAKNFKIEDDMLGNTIYIEEVRDDCK